MKTQDVLEALEWGEKHFGSLTTNRKVQRRDVERCVRAGLAESAGMVVLCDGDGFTLEPERYREGFRLTSAGRAMLAAARDAEAPIHYWPGGSDYRSVCGVELKRATSADEGTLTRSTKEE